MEPIKRPVGRPRKNQALTVKPAKSTNYRSAARRATARAEVTPYVYPIKPPTLAPGVVPADVTAPVLSMDSNPYAYAMQTYPGGGFPGFPYLAQLATRAEYRAFASTMSTELTREWIEFTSTQDDDSDSAEKIKQIEAAFTALNVRAVIQAAAEHDCLFGRGQLAITIAGADRSTPLVLSPRTVAKGCIVRLSAVEPIWTTPNEYGTIDPTAPDFYRPVSWFMLGQKIHASRLLTVVTRPLPDILKPAFNFAGMSLSQLAEPYVDNWLRTRQSVADLINNFSITALATSMDQVLQDEDDGANLFARADLFTQTRSNRGLMLLDKDREELVQTNTPLSGLHELQAQSQEHMCLAEGTLVETDRGQVPIEKVVIGDKVLTRDGYAPVEWAGVTNYTARLIEIDTGVSILRATEGHPIWSTTTNDFVNAMNVQVSHGLRKSRGWGYTGGRCPGAVAFGAQLSQDTCETQKGAGCSTGCCGKLTSGGFLTDLMCTIRTVTRKIIGCRIWNFCREKSTPGSMNLKDGGDSSDLKLKNPASSAEVCLQLQSPIERNIAQGHAKHQPGESVTPIASVTSVDLNERVPVYNLKVADGYLPEFYANGVLVHNCSVSRMPAIVLTGISPSGLNASSEGEIRVFYDWIAAQQEAHWREPLAVILKVVQLSLFGEIDPDINFKFVPLYQMTPEQEAEIRSKDGATDCAYVTSGVLDPSEVRDRLAKDPNSGYQGLDADAVPVPPVQPAPDETDPTEEGAP